MDRVLIRMLINRVNVYDGPLLGMHSCAKHPIVQSALQDYRNRVGQDLKLSVDVSRNLSKYEKGEVF